MSKSRGTAAIVLAGGLSRRFGSDKLSTEIDGVAMLHRVVEAAKGAVSEVYISVGSGDGSRPPDRSQDSSPDSSTGRSFGVSNDLVEAAGLPVLRDEIAGVGPIGGLYTAFRQVEVEWVLVVAGDMPFLTPGCLLELMAEASQDVDAVVARGPDGRIHPLLACYRSSILPTIERCLKGRSFAMKTLISNLRRVRYVTFQDDTLRNVNRPKDLRNVQDGPHRSHE